MALAPSQTPQLTKRSSACPHNRPTIGLHFMAKLGTELESRPDPLQLGTCHLIQTSRLIITTIIISRGSLRSSQPISKHSRLIWQLPRSSTWLITILVGMSAVDRIFHLSLAPVMWRRFHLKIKMEVGSLAGLRLWNRAWKIYKRCWRLRRTSFISRIPRSIRSPFKSLKKMLASWRSWASKPNCSSRCPLIT